jgi:hypothetical protein
MKSDFQIFKEAIEEWVSAKKKSIIVKTNSRENGFDFCIAFSKDLNQQTFVKYIPFQRNEISFYRENDLVQIVKDPRLNDNKWLQEVKNRKRSLIRKIKDWILVRVI